ncbi:MAG: YggT family protein [Acidobacteriota bacterium]|nr:YggT family protein [Acidobacteriota bacterium]
MLGQLIDIYSLVVLVGVVMSWVQLPPSNPIAQFVHAATEPVLEPIRRALPPMSGLDFSPMVLLLGLRFLRGLF